MELIYFTASLVWLQFRRPKHLCGNITEKVLFEQTDSFILFNKLS